MDVWKRLAEAANIVSAFIAVYLLLKPSVSGTAGQAVNQVPVHAPVNTPLVVLCISVFCASVLNFIALRRKLEIRPSVAPEQPAPVSVENTAVADQPASVDTMPLQFGTQTVLPDGRVITSCTLEDLITAFKQKTNYQFNKAFRGKWVKISGQIDDSHGDGRVYLKTPTGSPTLTRLRFGKGWEGALSELSRGATITIRGKFGESDSSALRLDECELL